MNKDLRKFIRMKYIVRNNNLYHFGWKNKTGC